MHSSSTSYFSYQSKALDIDEELNIDELLIPDFKEQEKNSFEKYACSSTYLPTYDFNTPLVKFLEGRSGSFSFKQDC